ncbi:hypothetical protein [Ruixingdingia sedimenti]|uniref:DUF551 domain-containing protein n=1 Tax=Ruixingdingia sedimenti TaxID=3073604 RepID=A0ABU1FF53_9RHOB|nr:hypothetical protein [Xinfangfangia sp. LG-4]MDR5655007.1 hypothetical protein [Xinfangfangia sp. LG-4]
MHPTQPEHHPLPLDEALTEGQEPVAWAEMFKSGKVASVRRLRDEYRTVPLYAHPANPAPALDPGWQPIETAPMDGSSFLAWYPTPPMCVDAWDVRRTWWAPEDGRWDTTDMTVDPHDPEAPTHWTPLPAPPRSDMGA